MSDTAELVTSREKNERYRLRWAQKKTTENVTNGAKTLECDYLSVFD